MSRIYFHSIDGDAEVRGFERGYASILAEQFVFGVLGWDQIYDETRIRAMVDIPKGHYSDAPERHRTVQEWVSSLKTAMSVNPGSGPQLRGPRGLDPLWAVAANTINNIGSDAWVFAIRLHHQCEIHAWIPTEEQPWFADVIRRGRTEGILRQDAGWEAVADLLDRQTGPVATSYSVCEAFPDMGQAISNGVWRPSVAYGDEDGAWEEWDALPVEEQFDIGFRYVLPDCRLTQSGLRDKWANETTAFEVVDHAITQQREGDQAAAN